MLFRCAINWSKKKEKERKKKLIFKAWKIKWTNRQTQRQMEWGFTWWTLPEKYLYIPIIYILYWPFELYFEDDIEIKKRFYMTEFYTQRKTVKMFSRKREKWIFNSKCSFYIMFATSSCNTLAYKEHHKQQQQLFISLNKT